VDLRGGSRSHPSPSKIFKGTPPWRLVLATSGPDWPTTPGFGSRPAFGRTGALHVLLPASNLQRHDASAGERADVAVEGEAYVEGRRMIFPWSSEATSLPAESEASHACQQPYGPCQQRPSAGRASGRSMGAKRARV